MCMDFQWDNKNLGISSNTHQIVIETKTILWLEILGFHVHLLLTVAANEPCRGKSEFSVKALKLEL